MSPPALWLALALVLGVAELMLPGVFLVFLAMGAAVTAAVSLAVPDLGLTAQIGAFGAWSAAAVVIGGRWYRDYAPPSDDALLNDRGARLVGQVVVVETAIVGGHGRVVVGDATWTARGADAAVGAQVRIVAVEGGVVVVEPVAG